MSSSERRSSTPPPPSTPGAWTTATRLAADREISRQAVAKHLGVLDRTGLVVSERHGRETRYRAQPAPLRTAVDWIEATGSAWDRRLERLTTLLED